MTTAIEPDAEGSGPGLDRGSSSRRFVFLAGVLATVAIGAVSALLGDLEGGAVTLGLGLATWLTRVRRGTMGAIGVSLAGAITLYFMLTAALTNIREGSPVSSVVLSSVLAAVSLLALVTAGWFLVERDAQTSTWGWLGVGLSVLLLAGLVAAGAVTSRVHTAGGDIGLESENMAFSETELRVDAGEVLVTMENKDLFWHTFTIEELGLDLRVPLGAELGVSFEASPGEYQFVCAIPGHADAGMVGTLTVES